MCGLWCLQRGNAQEGTAYILGSFKSSTESDSYPVGHVPFEDTGLDTGEDESCSSCDQNPFQIPSAIAFLVHRYVGTGEVKEISLNRL